MESIFWLIVSVSMLTALPTASIKRAALWDFGQLFPSSEFFDNPGQSLIQSAKYLLSWCRKGRYLQCPPRKEPPDIRFATSPTRHRIAGCERPVRTNRFPRTQTSCWEDGVNRAERPVDQIHNLLVWRAVQRESFYCSKSATRGQECICIFTQTNAKRWTSGQQYANVSCWGQLEMAWIHLNTTRFNYSESTLSFERH